MTGSVRFSVRPQPLLWFGLLAALVVSTEYYAMHRPDFSYRPALPPAVAFDLLVVLPALFYGLVVRRYRLPLSTVAAVFGAGLALSHWLLPGGLPLLAWAGWVAGGLEALTLGYAAVRLGRVVRGYRAARQQSADFLDNLHAAAQPVLGRLTAAVATEVAVWRYAVLGWWAAPEVGPGQVPFSTYRQSGFAALLGTLAGLSAIELGAAHLITAHWYPRVAWGLTGLSAYSLLWLLAHGQAVRRRPVLVSSAGLVVRVGLVWRITLAPGQLRRLDTLAATPAPAPGLLQAARLLLTAPNLRLTLTTPQVVRGPFGFHRTVHHLAFYVDEPAALTRQLVAHGLLPA